MEQHAELAETLAQSACRLGPTRPLLTGHDVLFYRTEAFLVRAVVNFLADGMRSGQPAIIVATESHRKAFMAGLRARGLDPDQIFSDRQAIWLDAREALAAFMEGGLPNRDLFMSTVGNVFDTLIAKRSYVIVRGYGEMVDLLYRDGNHEGAILVEQLWNEVADRYQYSLLCAYCLDNFLHKKGRESLRRVCDHHTHALPAELGAVD
jgi:hypothetical protein